MSIRAYLSITLLFGAQATAAELFGVTLGQTVKQSFGVDSVTLSDTSLRHCYQQSISESLQLNEWLADQVNDELLQLDEHSIASVSPSRYQQAVWNDGQLQQLSESDQLVVCHFDFQNGGRYDNPIQQAMHDFYKDDPVSQVGIAFLRHSGQIVTFSAYKTKPLAADLVNVKRRFSAQWHDAEVIEGGSYFEFAQHSYCEITGLHSAHCSFDQQAKAQLMIEQQPQLYAHLRELVGTLTIVELERLPATAAGPVREASYREFNYSFSDCEPRQ